MKKYLYTALTAALVLSSCASDEMVETAPSRTPISINVYTQGLTRFEATTAATIETIYLSVKNGTTTYFEGEIEVATGQIELKDNDGNTIFWPLDGGLLTFTAIANNTFSATGDITWDGSTDMIVAQVTSNKTTDGSVTLPFSHALAAATYQAQATELSINGTKARLNSITLTPANNTTYNCFTDTWETVDPSLYTFDFETAVTEANDEAATTLYMSEADDDPEYLFQPGRYSVEVKYSIVNGQTVGDEITKTGAVTLEAGSRYNILFNLPLTLTPMTIQIGEVEGWPTGGTSVTPDLTTQP